MMPHKHFTIELGTVSIGKHSDVD